MYFMPLYHFAGISGLDLRGVWVQSFDYSATQFGPFSYALTRFGTVESARVLYEKIESDNCSLRALYLAFFMLPTYNLP